MCGICGILDFGGWRNACPIGSMVSTLQHRGPDDDGVFVCGPAALGHTRLSILDLSSAGHQPMLSEDGRVAISHNGEVYNFPELRKQLESEGCTFGSRTDTEVVLQAFLKWGTEAFRRLKGMFATSIWDGRSEELHLVRDRFGIKPLYYFELPQGIVFGSEIKALLASQRIPRRLDLSALHEYLYFGNALGKKTLFRGVQALDPGCCLTVSRGGCRTRPYWRIEDVRPVEDSPNQAARHCLSLLKRAVQAHLISDVPVGVFLSGGIDSSSITALASQNYPGRLKTYSVGFDFDEGVNELPKAKRVAQRFGTEHHELHINGYSLPETLACLVDCHDQPFADAANIPLYLLCKQLGGTPKVILQGDGGDEIFAGYRRYGVLSASRFWQMSAPVGLAMNAIATRGPGMQRRARFLHAVRQSDPAMRMALLLTLETLQFPPSRILSPELNNAVMNSDPFARYKELERRLSHLDPVQKMLYTDAMILLPNIFLEKVDRPTMAHSIEVRVPFLDYNLTDYAMGLPSGVKVRRGHKKWLLRKALRGIIPNEILDAPKTGFGVPYAYWLRKPLASFLKDALLGDTESCSNWFDRQALQKLISEHSEGRRNHGFVLWKALLLAIWQRRFKIGV